MIKHIYQCDRCGDCVQISENKENSRPNDWYYMQDLDIDKNNLICSKCKESYFELINKFMEN